MSALNDHCLPVIEQFHLETHLEGYNFFDAHLLDPLPLDVEIALSDSWPRFKELGRDEWEELRKYVVLDVAAKFLAYSLRMASLAIQSSDSSPICWGTMGLVLDDVLDIRDVLRVLCALYDAGLRVGMEPGNVIKQCARFATTRRANFLTNEFVDGPDYTKNLASMGMSIIETKGVLWYKGGA